MKKVEKYKFGNIIPKGYGRGIWIIAMELISSFFKEKRFYITLFYYMILPLFLVLVQSGQPVIQDGTGIAIYYAQLNTTIYVKTLFLSFFPGQIFLVILSADQIAGEVEQETYPLLISKPVYNSEIVLGKFFGSVLSLAIIELPTLVIIYIFYLIKYNAEWYFAYITSIDEILVMLLIVIILQSIILAIAILISSAFERSLYAILTSILSLFMISSFSDIFTGEDGSNYLSFVWLTDAVLPNVFFNLEPLNNSSIGLSTFFGFSILIITGLVIASTIVLRQKEIY